MGHRGANGIEGSEVASHLTRRTSVWRLAFSICRLFRVLHQVSCCFVFNRVSRSRCIISLACCTPYPETATHILLPPICPVVQIILYYFRSESVSSTLPDHCSCNLSSLRLDRHSIEVLSTVQPHYNGALAERQGRKVQGKWTFPARQYLVSFVPSPHLLQVTSLPEKSSTKPKDAKTTTTSKSKSSKPSKKDELKQNVLALGGTLDDIELVNGSGSGGGEFKDDGKVDVSYSLKVLYMRGSDLTEYRPVLRETSPSS